MNDALPVSHQSNFHLSNYVQLAINFNDFKRCISLGPQWVGVLSGNGSGYFIRVERVPYRVFFDTVCTVSVHLRYIEIVQQHVHVAMLFTCTVAKTLYSNHPIGFSGEKWIPYYL